MLCLCVADLPTCLLCVCLTGSVYCEEVAPDMTTVPALPKETAYLYARFNKIKKISTKDFADIRKSGNSITTLFVQLCSGSEYSDSLFCFLKCFYCILLYTRSHHRMCYHGYLSFVFGTTNLRESLHYKLKV